MREVAILGVSMTKFGKQIERSLRSISAEAVLEAAKDAEISLKDVEMAYVGNGLQGLITGQEGVRGQVLLQEVGIGGIPIINVENACASGTTALFSGWMAVASGYADIVLVLGAEKLFCGDTPKSISALASDSDSEFEGRAGFSFPAYYALTIRKHMEKYGTTQEQLAKICVKNHKNGSLNPHAQYRKVFTIEEVLTAREVCWPITLPMAAPMGDGASALILTSSEIARRHTTEPVFIADSQIASTRPYDSFDVDRPDMIEILAKKIYEKAGIGPEDLGVIEVHDAMSSAEIYRYEALGLCKKGEGGKYIDDGAPELTGKHPVNTSGGLESKGHPIGATGPAMAAEIVWQLRGQAGERQVQPRPKVGLLQNGGGLVGGETACQTLNLFKR